MATVHHLRPGLAGPTLADAIAGYLATLDHPESAGTCRIYGGTVRALQAALGGDQPVADLTEPAAAEQLTAWFTGRWDRYIPSSNAERSIGQLVRSSEENSSGIRSSRCHSVPFAATCWTGYTWC
jgi:hypothetical protein